MKIRNVNFYQLFFIIIIYYLFVVFMRVVSDLPVAYCCCCSTVSMMFLSWSVPLHLVVCVYRLLCVCVTTPLVVSRCVLCGVCRQWSSFFFFLSSSSFTVALSYDVGFFFFFGCCYCCWFMCTMLLSYYRSCRLTLSLTCNSFFSFHSLLNQLNESSVVFFFFWLNDMRFYSM